uniref:S9 family peptidase n=1 Tax=Gelidibacter sp. TaxID=2018083 RepID=UPI003262F330
MSIGQVNSTLTVEKIMSDRVYLGETPTEVRWSEDSKRVLFKWRPMDKENNAVYQMSIKERVPKILNVNETNSLNIMEASFSKDLKKMLFQRDGDIFLKDIKSGVESVVVATDEFESAPYFNDDETIVIFQRGNNLYQIGLSGQGLKQITNFTREQFYEGKTIKDKGAWLQKDQLRLFDVLKRQHTNKKNDNDKSTLPRSYFLPASSTISNLSIDKHMIFVVFSIADQSENSRTIEVPNYVTLSGYTENIAGRTKVGAILPTYSTRIYDLERDTIYDVLTNNIPQIKRLPEYIKDYPEQLERLTKENKDRKVNISRPIWSPDRTSAVVNIVSQDNKDRWIMKLDPLNGKLFPLDHQHDEAWIGGPGIGSFYGTLNLGWINENTIYFQSEVTGYSHVYSLNVTNKEKKQLTSGSFEVQTLQLSNDKKFFYLTANLENPGITHFYKLSVNGGDLIKLTSIKGLNEVTLSPDEKWLAIRHSSITKPWELYLQENKPIAEAVQTTQTTSPDFVAYSWKIPETIVFKNRNGVDTYAQVFKPTKPLKNKTAVVFVHSNGYLQNVHYGWSYHFREYMFNNLLVDEGFTVINIDYNASSGYGRDYRTGIYRHMGGRDLSDVTDSAKLLVEKYHVNPDYIGLYGGSYGGFLTLMGLFTEPEVFKAGAALRSVTDWAHYNQRYTSNILNEPLTDENAYKRSSPIYFADGLKGHLLMTHGVVDVNVNFQDVVRLSQKLIELGKDDWELALYPLEDHNFIEPSSWTDQYKRILKLFKNTLTE